MNCACVNPLTHVVRLGRFGSYGSSEANSENSGFSAGSTTEAKRRPRSKEHDKRGVTLSTLRHKRTRVVYFPDGNQVARVTLGIPPSGTETARKSWPVGIGPNSSVRTTQSFITPAVARPAFSARTALWPQSRRSRPPSMSLLPAALSPSCCAVSPLPPAAQCPASTAQRPPPASAHTETAASVRTRSRVSERRPKGWTC